MQSVSTELQFKKKLILFYNSKNCIDIFFILYQIV